MARQLLLLAMVVAIAGCDRAVREMERAKVALARAEQARAEDMADPVRDEATANARGVRDAGNPAELAMVGWTNVVLPVDRPVETIDENMRLTWQLADDPHSWSEVEIVAVESGVPPDALLTALSTKLASLPWAQLKNACYEGGAFKDFGTGTHDLLEWEVTSTDGPDGLPMVTARFRLVE